MSLSHGQDLLSRRVPFEPLGWDWQLAYWITQLGSPPVLTTAAALLCGYSLATSAAWLWTTLYILLIILIPSLYVLWLFQQGRISDIHLRIRAQRTRPLLVTLAAALALWGLLRAGNAPVLLLALTGANVAQTILFFLITLHWKISAHAAAAAGLAMLVWWLVGPAALTCFALIPLIAWARIRLGDHTPAQTAAGATLGSLVLAVAFSVYGG